MRTALALLVALVALGCGREEPAGPPPVLPLHEVGPWPWVSSLVAHRGRLWLANSDRTRDCSCADLYSFDPSDGSLRYERHLFSQSVGRPAVHEGLLYWPLEDSRFNLGAAHVAVTDGEGWRHLVVEDAQPLVHATAVASDGRRLWLATANPGLRLFASLDRGGTWAGQGGAPRAEGIRWVLRAVPFAGGLYGVVIDGGPGRARRFLARIDAGRPERIPGPPPAADVLEALVHEGRLVALVEIAGAGSLWTGDGARLERLGPGPPRGRLRDLAVGEDGALWALTLERPGGGVWRRSDTGRWRLEARLEGGPPQELELLGGRPYVAGNRTGGAGALWGAVGPAGTPAEETRASAPESPERAEAGSALAARASLPEPPRRAAGDADALVARARAALGRAEAYQARARGARAALRALAASEAPAAAFTGLLAGPFPDASAPFLQDETPVPARLLGPWLVLWAISIAGRGHVPVSLLAEPWPAQPLGRDEKHFEPLLAALEAIAWTGQSDTDTLDALVARLAAPGDPAFVRGDVVGALSAVTGEPHGYDAEAWRHWWAGAREGRRGGPAALAPGPP